MAVTKRLPHAALLFGALVLFAVCVSNAASSALPTSPTTSSCDGKAHQDCLKYENLSSCEKGLIQEANTSTDSSLLLDVSSGFEVLKRLMRQFYQDKLFFKPNTPDAFFKFHEKGLQGLAVLQQYLSIFNLLNPNGESESVTYFQVIANQLLKDTCNWLNSHTNSSINNCDNPVEFALIMMSLHIREFLDYDTECYLDYYKVMDLQEQKWANRTITAYNETLRYDFCESFGWTSECESKQPNN